MTYESDLRLLRKQIDDIDSELISLLQKRATFVKEIEELKFSQGAPVLDSSRENSILTRYAKFVQANDGLLSEAEVLTVMKTVIQTCRGFAEKIRSRRDPKSR